VSGCDLPLIGRNGVVGVLSALKRSERTFEKEDVIFLEQVARQVAIAVENALEYQRAIKDRDKETKQRLYLEEEIRIQCGAIVGESSALNAALQLVSVVPRSMGAGARYDRRTGHQAVSRKGWHRPLR
jgi:formate hydrogenlyase transcriptional activator